jgi:mono/diheme cytochrome c family protein
MNCDGCHGSGGLGFVGPNLVDGRWRFGGSDSAVFSPSSGPRPDAAYGRLLGQHSLAARHHIKSQPVPVDVATEAWP